MSKNHIAREISKLAGEIYEKAIASGEHFTVEDLAEKLVAELRQRYKDQTKSIVGDLIASTAHSSMREVDKARTKFDAHPQLTDDLDRPIPVGKSKRRARRRMTNTDWAQHIAMLADNQSRVNAAAAKEQRRYAALLPYLSAGLDTEDALAAWQGEHPDEVLS